VPNVSVCVAAFVTAYARIHMSRFKNNKDFTIYYSDTDSVDIDKPLDSKFVGKELGQMKLEHIFEKIVYLAPKVYAAKIINEEGIEEDFVKIKGVKVPISFEEMKKLLQKGEATKIKQEK
jgi:hypothetical protein